MTYVQAEKIMTNSLLALVANPGLTLQGAPFRFMGLMAAPSNALPNQKEEIFRDCIEKGINNHIVLRDAGLLAEDLNVFIIGMFQGNKTIMSLKSYLSNP